MIEGPARIGVLAEAPLGVEQATFRAIDARMIVRRRRAARDRASSRRGSATTTATTTSTAGSWRATPTSTRSRPAATSRSPSGCSIGGAFALLGQQGRLRRRQRRLQAEGNDRHAVRRLWRRAVVRRRDARRRRSRFQRRASQYPARRAESHRKRRHARLARDGERARRLLVHATATGCTVRSRASRTRRSTSRASPRRGSDSTALVVRRAGAQVVHHEPWLAGRRARSATCGRSRASTWELESKDDERFVVGVVGHARRQLLGSGHQAGQQLPAVPGRRERRFRPRDRLRRRARRRRAAATATATA